MSLVVFTPPPATAQASPAPAVLQTLLDLAAFIIAAASTSPSAVALGPHGAPGEMHHVRVRPRPGGASLGRAAGPGDRVARAGRRQRGLPDGWAAGAGGPAGRVGGAG
ncbi:hypothetical protein DL762_005605 [Monosporascus cannonballus]|uniref:Uncharacterized protein n=1 Tax=Monosporascus cannonballus TaxID=155416 RepID=A0ABY0H8V5_9PEZI|nr:hypothetical protein DL763_009877 [Monosporascus cannonballus]RYO84615.1 hypothetical protein DL762_005605 [Monosporascus cannonballus]